MVLNPLGSNLRPESPISSMMEVNVANMIPIPIAEFIMGSKIPVDLYIRLSDEKFICLAKAGSPTDKEQLKSYNNKEVTYLWVHRDEYQKVAQQSISIAGLIVGKKDVDFKNKTTIMTHAARTVFTQMEHLGMSEEAYNNAKVITEAMVSMCESHRDLSALFEGLKNCSDQLLAHSMAVSALSVMIGISLGFEKKVTLEKLSLGGLLHDIGKKTLPPDLLKKPIAKMTPEEIAYYENHPYRGMQLALSLGIVPDDIVSIIYEHHENALGQGYPQRLRDVKIHPLAKIVGLADQFINLVMANPNCPIAKSPREAIVYIELTMGRPYNKDVFKALKSIVEKDPKLGAA